MRGRKIYDPDWDHTKQDQSRDRIYITSENVASIRAEAVYRNFTLKTFAQYLNAPEDYASCDARNFNIPLRKAGGLLFYDPSWEFVVVQKHDTLGDVVPNPKFQEPWGMEHRSLPVRYLTNHRVLPVAILALAQYKLGYVPEECREINCLAFRDGDMSNLRPENLVYTGREFLRNHTKARATFTELPPGEYSCRCARCRYRLPRDQEPVGWKDNVEYVSLVYANQTDPRYKGITHKIKGTLCPVCQRFTDRIWNGSMG